MFYSMKVQQTALLRNLEERKTRFDAHQQTASLHTKHRALCVGNSCTTVRDRILRRNTTATEILQQGERADRIQ